MQIDDTFLLKLLSELKTVATPWHSIEVFDEELLLDEPKLLFHLEMLIDRNYLAHRPAQFAGGRDLIERTDVSIDPWLFSRKSLLRLTAQGHEFAEDALAQARHQAAWDAFKKPRFRSPPHAKENAEHTMMGLDDIRVVFRIDDE